jgi:hypothetical protein
VRYKAEYILADKFNALKTDFDALAAKYASAVTWQPIETAPMDIPVLLGWWEEWPALKWICSADIAGHENDKPPGMSNGWRNGSATHWMPLPAPPKPIELGEQE